MYVFSLQFTDDLQNVLNHQLQEYGGDRPFYYLSDIVDITNNGSPCKAYY